MKMKKVQILKGILLTGFLASLTVSCSNLEEKVLDGQISSKTNGTGTVDTKASLGAAIAGLREFQGQGQMWTLGEMTTDALVGPTRGGDWDDNGDWRAVHTHLWTANHVQVRDSWNTLLSKIYFCNQVIYNNAPVAETLQARFLKDFYSYWVVDMFGQLPYRDQGSDPEKNALVYPRAQATEIIIKDLEEIVTKLPVRVSGKPEEINQDAARFLLAKIYLNKAVFTSANPAGGTFTFAKADMDKVISNVDAMTNTLATKYWDNFAPDNNTSNEIAFTTKNVRGSEAGGGGSMQGKWRMCSHYAQTPDGWNGFSTLSEYYDKFNPNDKRINYNDTEIINAYGNNLGFRIGQQYAPGGTKALKDRNDNPLVFTKDLSIITGGKTLETAGIRGIKYVPDPKDFNLPENDYVLMRYSDALLMKAEAIARGGSGSIGTIMTDISSRVSQTASPATLDGIYAERAKELWWEGWRRNDMVRFGKFLDPNSLKQKKSADRYILFPIPSAATLNPNLKQNPGY